MKKIFLLLMVVMTLMPKLLANNSLNISDSIQLNEVVVSVSKQKLSQLMLPSSATVIYQRHIVDLGLVNVPDISAVVPNLLFHDYGSKLTSPIYIRGIGSKLGSPSVVMYIDNVPYYAKALMNTELSDVNSIEVLRGPQGTEFGRNTMGGVINIRTIDPEKFQGAKLHINSGTYNDHMASAGLYAKAGKFSISLNSYFLHRDGFFTNKFNGEKADKINSFGVRNKIGYRIAPNSRINNVFSLVDSYQNASPYALYEVNSHKFSGVNYDSPSLYNNFTVNDAVTFDYKKGAYTISSASTIQYYNDKQVIDQDFTPKSLILAQQDSYQYDLTQDVNLRINHSANVNFLFGIFGFYQQSNKNIVADVKPRKLVTYKDYNNYIYGLSVYHSTKVDNVFINGLTLNAGIRMDLENSILNYSNENNKPITVNTKVDEITSPLFWEIMPKLSISYAKEYYNVYASISRGYQSGGFNTSYDDKKNIVYKPEYSWNYELGVKSNLLYNYLYADLSLFYIDWRDQHVFKPLAIGSMTTNAGHSFSRGVEASLSLSPINGFSALASYGYTDARYINNNTSKNTNFNDNRIPYVPQHTASIMLKQQFNVGYYSIDNVSFIIKGKGLGKIFYDEGNTLFQDFYTLLDASFDILLSGKVGISLWGKNILGTEYTAYQFNFMKKTLAQLGRPRQIGLTLNVDL